MLLTVEGEEALRRLHSLAAFVERWSAARDNDGPARLGNEGRSSTDIRTIQETVIVRCVTVIEAYLADLARRLVSDRLADIPAGDASVVSLTRYLSNSSLLALDHGRWEDLISLWVSGLGVPIKQGFAEYGKLVALRTTRHAIAHRYGEITDLYRKQHRQRLEDEGFRDPLAAEGAVPLTDADVRDALALAITTVRWLEQTLVIAPVDDTA